jgi:hypothetical protein
MLNVYFSHRYRITEAEAYSGIVLKNGKRRKMKDHDLKVSLTMCSIPLEPGLTHPL